MLTGCVFSSPSITFCPRSSFVLFVFFSVLGKQKSGNQISIGVVSLNMFWLTHGQFLRRREANIQFGQGHSPGVLLLSISHCARLFCLKYLKTAETVNPCGVNWSGAFTR